MGKCASLAMEIVAFARAAFFVLLAIRDMCNIKGFVKQLVLLVILVFLSKGPIFCQVKFVMIVLEQ